jgi:uncharacterized protein YjbI with pentapeptide repeats
MEHDDLNAPAAGFSKKQLSDQPAQTAADSPILAPAPVQAVQAAADKSEPLLTAAPAADEQPNLWAEPAAPAIEPETPGAQHQSLPQADTLIKPFETTPTEENTIPPAPALIEEESTQSHATFRRLDEDEAETSAPAIEPSTTISTPAEEEKQETEEEPILLEEDDLEEIDTEALDEVTEQAIEAAPIITEQHPLNTAPPAPAEEATAEDLPEIEAGALAGGGTQDGSTIDGVKALIEEHRLWVESNGEQGRRAIFRDLNLNGYDFSNQRLSGATFRGQDLTHANFTGAELVEADFSDCQLQGANFSNSLLHRSNLTQSKAHKTSFKAAQLVEADLSRMSAEESDFSNAQLTDAVLRDAQFLQCSFTQTNAERANFRGSDLSQSKFTESSLSEANLRDTQLHYARIENTVLQGAHFQNAQMEGVDLNKADFSQAAEVPEEVHARYMQEQRSQLQEQEKKFDDIRNELEKRERKLIAEREELQRELIKSKQQKTDETITNIGDTTNAIQKSTKLFLMLGIAWFVICFLLFIVLQNVFSQLDTNQLSIGELLLMAVLLIGPTVLFVITMAKCFAISHKLQRISPENK